MVEADHEPTIAPVKGAKQMESRARLASGINVLAGIWLFLAPMVLGYADMEQALWNDRVIGVAIFVLALTRVAAPDRFAAISWVNFVLGAWLIIAPFLLFYGGVSAVGEPVAATGNDILVGILVIAMAAWSASATNRLPSGSGEPTGTTPVNVAERPGVDADR